MNSEDKTRVLSQLLSKPITGRWVRYKLYYENDPIRPADWTYEHLSSFYPEQCIDPSSWERKFKESKINGGRYTCELEEIKRSDMLKEIIKIEKEKFTKLVKRYKEIVKRAEDELKLLEQEK